MENSQESIEAAPHASRHIAAAIRKCSARGAVARDAAFPPFLALALIQNTASYELATSQDRLNDYSGNFPTNFKLAFTPL
uniref:Uncharacterized protein n=1 Tax=Heterorhabditis bacteriophora TaxID=37862 RepID=A0A1I7XJU5_HETBA